MDFSKIDFPTIQRVIPQTMSDYLVPVQPISWPTGLSYCVDFVYDSGPLTKIQHEFLVWLRDSKDNLREVLTPIIDSGKYSDVDKSMLNDLRTRYEKQFIQSRK